MCLCRVFFRSPLPGRYRNCLPSLLHCGISYLVVFIESRPFTSRVHELAGASALDVLNRIQQDLLKEPQRGDLVQGLGGVRKARVSNPARGKGKRGGFRYFFLYLERRSHIHLLLLLDKGEQPDLTQNQRKAVRLLVEQVKQQ